MRAGDGRKPGRLFSGPDGSFLGRYDKIPMFDVDLDNGESWRESAVYGPGQSAHYGRSLTARGFGLGFATISVSHICFRDLAFAGAQIMTALAAFTRRPGKAPLACAAARRASRTSALR